MEHLVVLCFSPKRVRLHGEASFLVEAVAEQADALVTFCARLLVVSETLPSRASQMESLVAAPPSCSTDEPVAL